MSTHNVDINVNANTADAQKSLGYLQTLMGEFGKQATNRMAGLLGAAAVAKMAFDKVSEAISANIAAAKQVSQMAIKFNIDPTAMHSITMAAKDAGVSVRALTMSMKQLGKTAEKAMTNKDMQANFKQLGIEAEQLNEIQAKPSKFLPQIAKSLMEIGDENQRSAAGALLLGRQYQMLLPLIEELGTSEEARAKFLDNQNAMSEEEIAANKEIAEIQNELTDGFEKMVASVAPLLAWAMNFVNLLAQGLGFIKDMIFETDKAKKERETKSSSDVAKRVSNYQSGLKVRQENGTLTDAEKKGIKEAGGTVEAYVAKQVTSLETERKAYQEIGANNEEAGGFWTDNPINAMTDSYKKMKARRDAKNLALRKKIAENKGIVDPELEKSLGIHSSQKGEIGYLGQDDDAKMHSKRKLDLATAIDAGDLKKIATLGVDAAGKQLRGKADAAREARMKEQLAKYVSTKKSQAAVLGRAYDPATDQMYDKNEYKELLQSRGASDTDIAQQIKTFEEESARVKRESAEKRSVRALEGSKRRLYMRDPETGLTTFKRNVDEITAAEDALQDKRDANVAPQEDYDEQDGIVKGLQEQLKVQEESDKAENLDKDANILRIQMQISQEMLKHRELATKLNDAKAQEIQLEENLRKAKEKRYFEDRVEHEKSKSRFKDRASTEKELEYKLMRSEGKSKKEIDEKRMSDDQVEYERMLAEYRKTYEEFEKNDIKGPGGRKLNDEEEKQLQELTKGLDAKQKSLLEQALDLGDQKGEGKVTDMRRIGGGGMEFGGLESTARQQVNLQREANNKLEKIYGVLVGDRSNMKGGFTDPIIMPGKMGTDTPNPNSPVMSSLSIGFNTLLSTLGYGQLGSQLQRLIPGGSPDGYNNKTPGP
jgi:hypothetical protein